MPYNPYIDEEEDPTLPPVEAEPDDSAALPAMVAPASPPAPVRQDPYMQYIGGLGDQGANPDLKALLLAKLKSGANDAAQLREQAAADKAKSDAENKQVLYAKLGDRMNDLVRRSGSIMGHMPDAVAAEAPAYQGQVGKQQSEREKLRAALMAKMQGGQDTAIKGLIGLNKSEADRKAAEDKLIAGQRFTAEQNELNRKASQSRAETMAGAFKEKADYMANLNPNKKSFEMLPVPAQEEIKVLAKEVATKDSVARQIDAETKNMEASLAAGDEDQALVAGRNMLKVLNSTEGKDAVGTDEAKRLGAFLEYKIANFTGPGSFMGRDLDQFVEQAKLKSNAIKMATQDSRKRIDEASSGKSANYDLYAPAAPKAQPGTAQAAPIGPSPQDKAALQWANDPANAKNPKLPDVMKKLKAKGLL